VNEIHEKIENTSNIKKPLRNPNFPPNQYDLMVVSNGCGNKFTAETLGIDVDGEFEPACAKHDWDWSRFSDKSEEEGNDDFYNNMQEIIDSNDHNFIIDGLEWLQKQLFHGLVDTIGGGSYEEYDPLAIPPSLRWEKDCKMKDVECVNIKVLISDNTYLLRWYTLQEAEFEGLTEYAFFYDDIEQETLKENMKRLIDSEKGKE
jgi:hypothetical protein